ncbi:MAG: transposase [Planctomycetales bacterium]|nr:transposase [Planctomycetales bacterium]
MVFEHCPEIAEGWRIASGFIALLKTGIGEDIPAWLDRAMHETAPKELRNFAKGILRDDSAIVAAITLPWSNGQTEGQVNRLKTLKRQMYRRGSFDLLRLRFLSAA